jgi:hypothetical protein
MTVSDVMLQSILDVLRAEYRNGFRFDATALRLLSYKTGMAIDDDMQSLMVKALYRRGDDMYYSPDSIASDRTRASLKEAAGALLDEYGFFEISVLYEQFRDLLNPKCIRNADDFEGFYRFIHGREDIRCVSIPAMGNRIARLRNQNAEGLLSGIASRIYTMAHHDFGGTVTEDQLHTQFHVFSLDLLSKIIQNDFGGLVFIRTVINDTVVYQTLEALAFPDDFSETLSHTLDHLEALALLPSEENLHTALCIAMNTNLKAEYNIPNQATYRRLIAAYYSNDPPREWKGGVFSEVSG